MRSLSSRVKHKTGWARQLKLLVIFYKIQRILHQRPPVRAAHDAFWDWLFHFGLPETEAWLDRRQRV